jgi:hypothetical protein
MDSLVARMELPSPVYRCRACGSTSYQRLTHRGPDGRMQYSGVHRCSGCSLRFSQLESWRERRLRPRLAAGEGPSGSQAGASQEASAERNPGGGAGSGAMSLPG